MTQQVNFWNKNNSHIRTVEPFFKQEIKASEINDNYDLSTLLFNNARVQQPITPGNIKLSTQGITSNNTFSSSFLPNVSYDKPMPLNKCKLAYSTY